MIKNSLIIILILFSTLSVCAQQTIKLWDETETNHKCRWSELTVFLPEKQDTSAVSVVICPGGSYVFLAMKNEGYKVAKYLNSKGITAFVLKYRTAWQHNHYPAMIEDLQRALKLVKENAKTYNINPEKVGVMGFSAGGHLAGTATLPQNLQSQILRPYFVAMIYPVVSMEDSICHKISRHNLLGKNYSNDLIHQLSLEQNVHAGMPPVFLLHCVGDKTVNYRNSVVLEKELTEKNVKHTFLLFEDHGKKCHGFGIQPNGKATGWIERFIDFITTNCTN
jgi:acetyl esterase/lipase